MYTYQVRSAKTDKDSTQKTIIRFKGSAEEGDLTGLQHLVHVHHFGVMFMAFEDTPSQDHAHQLGTVLLQTRDPKEAFGGMNVVWHGHCPSDPSGLFLLKDSVPPRLKHRKELRGANKKRKREKRRMTMIPTPKEIEV